MYGQEYESEKMLRQAMKQAPAEKQLKATYLTLIAVLPVLIGMPVLMFWLSSISYNLLWAVVPAVLYFLAVRIATWHYLQPSRLS
ncbi:MAG: hypothetical protein ABH846_03675 [Patescibacteria group bacterium]